MFEQEDDRQQREDLEAQERLALDCLIVIHKDGHESTADALAPLLGINGLWQQTKKQLHAQRRAA